MQSDPGTITLYLPDEQIVDNTASNAITATRYYSINGQVVAARTPNSSGSTTVTYLDSNQQGTSTLAVDSQQLTPTYRYFDPYGNPLGSPPSSWPGTRGFVGGTTDTATSLTNLGAREYNPATASFISTDPLIAPGDPRDLNAYAYALDDPSSSSDPTGQSDAVMCDGMPCGTAARAPAGPPPPSVGLPPSYTAAAVSACSLCAPLTRQIMRLDEVRSHVHHQVSNGTRPSCASPMDFRVGGCAPQDTSRFDGSVPPWLMKAVAVGATVFALVQGGIDPLADLVAGAADGAAVGGADLAAGAGASAAAGAAADASADRSVTPFCGESFTADTKVLLASGAAIPISQLRPGGKVLATNVKTGKTSPETVTAVMVKRDTDLYDLTVRSEHRTAVIHTTRNHLFWNPSADRWVKAAALKYGTRLRTSDGSLVTVTGGHDPSITTDWMWDLSIPGDNDHDFYVVVETMPILVHNASCGITEYSNHAQTRMWQRGISEDTVEQIVARGRQSAGNEPGTFKYTLGKNWVVTNAVRGGRVITIGWR